MASLNIHVSDDLKTYTATLILGDKRVPFPLGQTVHNALEPYTYWEGQKTPSQEIRKLLLEGVPQ